MQRYNNFIWPYLLRYIIIRFCSLFWKIFCIFAVSFKQQRKHGKNNKIIRSHRTRPVLLPSPLSRGSLAQTPLMAQDQSPPPAALRTAPPHVHARRGTINLRGTRRALTRATCQEIRKSYFRAGATYHYDKWLCFTQCLVLK